MSSGLGQTQSVPVSNAASTFVAGPNPKRKVLTLYSPAANRISISFNGAAVLDGGPTVQPGTSPLRLTYDDLGEQIQRQITAIAATAATQLNYSEEFDA